MRKMLLIAVGNAPGCIEEADLVADAKGVNIRTIAGNITKDRITDVTSGENFDMIHICAHSGPLGIELSDGELFGKEELSQLARHVRAKLIFLCSCSSTVLGQYMIDTGVPAVIVVNTPIEGNAGNTLAAYYYRELFRLQDYRNAYRAVNPGDGTVSFFSNGRYRDEDTARIIAAVNGNRRWLKWISAGWLFYLLLDIGVATFLAWTIITHVFGG